MTLIEPAGPIGAEPLLSFLLAVTILLLVARLLGRLAQKLALPAVVGELATGVLLGPSVLGQAPAIAGWLVPTEPQVLHLVDAVGQIGLLLLVGVVGARMELGLLRQHRRSVIAVSMAGLLVPLAAGLGLAALLPAGVAGSADRFVFATFLAVALCVSAVPVIAKIFTDMGLLHREVSQLTLVAAMIDDAIGWLLLALVSAAAVDGFTAGQVVRASGVLVGFMLLAAVVGFPLVRHTMRRAATAPDAGPTIAATAIIVLAGAATTHALGIEAILGAFTAGILIGAPGSADQAKLAGLRSVVLAVLAPIFLATAGLRMDLTALGDPSVAVTGVAVLLVAIVSKLAGGYLGARIGRRSHWEGVAIGTGLNARGVVEVIVALTGLRLGVLNTATYTVIVLVAIVTSLMAAPLLRLAMTHLPPSEQEQRRKRDHDAWDHG